MIFTINKDECTFCGLCAEECPGGVIRLDKNAGTAEINHTGCIECSHCGMVCPADAVRVDGGRLPAYPEDTDNIEHLILSKRSVRFYTKDPISGNDMKSIVLAGETTATASNSRQVEIIILEGAAVTGLSILISEVLLRVVKIGLNPLTGLLLKPFRLGRYADKGFLLNYHYRISETLAGRASIFFHNAPAVVILTYPVKGRRFGRTDCALAGQNMMLTAQNRGIGSCMIGFAEAALMTKKLRRRAGVGADRRIGLIFTLGYTKRKYYRYPKRNDRD